ncbi:MAG: ABC transporter permease [Candidatus Aminicenantes bacterium]|nr:ABC transporter permease [Candidatus Aminicenantes bacterium]
MTFLKLGFFNLFRQKRRTAISLLVITFGIGCLLLTIGHSKYIEWGLRESTIHSETGHLQVFDPRFFDQDEDTILEYGLEDSENIRTDLYRLPEVCLVLARIDLMGLISNGEKSVACIGQGVEPGLEKQMRTLFGNSGTQFDPLITENPESELILLGNGLAKSLDAKTGDYITLMTTTADGALNALDLKVAGTFSGFSPEYDARAMVIPLEAARMLLNTQKVKNLVVVLDKTENTDLLYHKILNHSKEKKYSIALRKWHEQADYYNQVKQFYHQITGFLSLVLFLIVFFSTSNTIVMTIVERTTEIGTMLSMGTSRWQALKSFFFEGLCIGMIGGVLSIVFAYGLSELINFLNITLPPPPGLTEGYPLMIRNEWAVYAQIFGVTILITSISSLFPALRATQMKIVDALGHI